MEDNKRKEAKSKLSLIAMLATMLVCCCVFTVLCVLGVIPIKTSVGYIDLKTAALVNKTTEVSDEETLRELLLLKKELSIVVTEDIEIDETFIVKGKKTLYGDAVISADVAGEYRTMYIFDVQPGASLIMNGLVLDGDGTADGINVGQNAELTYLSGTIQYMRYGIQTNGKVNFEDGLIQHSTLAGILASYRSKVYVNGGHLYNANSHLIHVDTNGYVEINEGADLSVCRGDAVFNAGDLYVYGGTIHDTVARAINTEGKLHMEYKGSKKDGYIEMYNIGSIAVRMNAHDDCYISDVHAVNVGTNGVFTTDLRSNGKTTVENCIFDTCAIVEGNGMSVSRKVEINNVTILNSQGGGINIRENGDVTMDGVTIDGTKGDGITIGAELEAKNIRIANVQANNIEVITGVEATILDSVLEKSKRTSVYMRKESTLTLDGVEVQGVLDEGLFNFHVNEGSVLNLKGDTSITGATRVAICLYKNTTLNMEDGKIFGINGTDNGAGVWVREEGAVFNMKGGSIENNTTTGSSGGVFVANKATFNMSGGTISGNSAKYSGGGVQVQGVMNFSGGTISNNKSETTGGGINVGNNASKGIYGTLNMTGGTVSNTYSINNGGGISVSGKTTANISGGTIKNNRSDGIGDGIHDNGNLTISGKAYIPGNTIGLNNKSIVLNIKGSSLSKHSANDPLLVVPVQSTFNGDIVVKCDSESAVDALLNKYVVSGNNAFTLAKKESNMTVNPNMADLDTTGAETVYVSNFQELKEAVESTKTKRNIVIGADIEMESKITVPSGTTVCIRDDGQVRTLSRQAGNTQKFFETWYGTGLVLKGTSEEKLVLDGGNADNKAEDYQQLVYVRGATKIENVAFANNGVGDKYTGTFVNQQYGSIEIVGSTFENGLAVDGGSVYTKAGSATITDCTFINNEATNRGGAICNANCETVITNSTFKNNTAEASGGAVYNAENGDLTLVGTSEMAVFEGNTSLAGVGGGALCVGTGTLNVDGYTFKNNVAENANGGAIQLNSTNSVVSITNSTFDSNKNIDKDATDDTVYNGGAIFTKAKELNVENTIFTNNSATGQGGAIATQGKALNVTDSTFGGAGVGNTSTGNGGAIYSGNKCTTTITSSKGSVFEENKSETGTGGAICVGTGHIEITGYTFDGNTSKSSGGAIRLNRDQITAEITDSVFIENTSDEGGAIGNASQHEDGLTVKACTFDHNTATADGGAIASRSKKTVVENTTFTNNEAVKQGGAILSHGGILNVTDSTFGGENAGNTSGGNGGAIYSGTSCAVTLTSTTGAKFEDNFSGTVGENGTVTLTGNGGAICVGSGTLNVTGYTFTNNSAVDGGAIKLNNPKIVATITGSSFESNKASSEGGAIYNESTHAQGLVISEVSFTDNTSSGSGGAIFAKQGGTVLTTNTAKAFSGNQAGSSTSNQMGGAIYADIGTISITGYTFTNNHAYSAGGAVRLAGSIATATFTNCTFTNNDALNGRGGAISNNSTSATDDAVTITDCKFENNAAKYGGAIHNRQSDLKIVGTKEVGAEGATAIFKENETTTDGQGGAIWVEGGNIIIDKYTFNANTSKDRGGAIWTKDGSIGTIANSVFNGNKAGGGGGAIHKEGQLTITNTDFTSNTSTGAGGAINNEKGNATIQNCDFISNQATNGNGGAMQVVGSGAVVTIEVTDGAEHVFQGNIAGSWNTDGTIKNVKVGGAIRTNTATLNVKGYKFDGNTATSDGGAVYVDSNGGAVNFENSAFVNNTTSINGGAVYAKKNITMTGCTFTSNTASVDGGAICLEATNAASTVTITGSVFKQNTAANWAGAIYVNTSAAVTIDGCQFGAESDDVVNNPTKYGNKAKYGGAILVNKDIAAKVTIKNNSSFVGNEATTNDGGAIFTWTGSTLNISNTQFRYNVAKANGGAMRLDNALKVVIEQDCLFQGNKTLNGYGGAIDHYKSYDVTIKNTDFVSNSAASHGGAVRSEAGEITLENCDFTGNSTQQDGGAYRVAAGAKVTMTNGTFSSNSAAKNGGAIQFNTGTVKIKNYVFVGNKVGETNNSINTNNCGGTHYTSLEGCTIEESEISGKGVKWVTE